MEHKVTLQKNVQLLQLPHHRQKEVWTHCNLSDTIFVNLGRVFYLIVPLDHALLQPRFQVPRSRRREGEEPGNKEVVIFGNCNNILLAGKKSNYFISRWSGVHVLKWGLGLSAPKLLDIKVMLHRTIRHDDFKRNKALQCWNNVVIIRNNVATILQRGAALKIVVANRLV